MLIAVALLVAAWIALSVPTAVIVGRMFAAGHASSSDSDLAGYSGFYGTESDDAA
jgi:hypothetical protein